MKHAALLLQLGQDTAIDLILIILQLSSTSNVRVVFVIGLLYTRRDIREATKKSFYWTFNPLQQNLSYDLPTSIVVGLHLSDLSVKISLTGLQS